MELDAKFLHKNERKKALKNVKKSDKILGEKTSHFVVILT